VFRKLQDLGPIPDRAETNININVLDKFRFRNIDELVASKVASPGAFAAAMLVAEGAMHPQSERQMYNIEKAAEALGVDKKSSEDSEICS
jgi:hypothetical protein